MKLRQITERICALACFGLLVAPHVLFAQKADYAGTLRGELLPSIQPILDYERARHPDMNWPVEAQVPDCGQFTADTIDAVFQQDGFNFAAGIPSLGIAVVCDPRTEFPEPSDKPCLGTTVDRKFADGEWDSVQFGNGDGIWDDNNLFTIIYHRQKGNVILCTKIFKGTFARNGEGLDGTEYGVFLENLKKEMRARRAKARPVKVRAKKKMKVRRTM